MNIIRKIINWLNQDIKYTHCKCCKRKFAENEKTYGWAYVGGGFCLSCISDILRK